MRCLLISLLSLLGVLPCLGQDGPNIAVVEVKGERGAPTDVSSYVCALLEEELIRSGQFNLVERNRLKEVLEEVAFQQSGVTAPETIAELGKQLNVEQLFFARVHRLRPDYKLTLKIVDVATNQIVRVEEVHLGHRDADIKAATLRLAQRLVQTASLLSPAETILFPAGRFVMGSAAGLPDERPPHPVSISAFYLDRHEVSQIAYQAFLEARKKPSSTRVEHPEHPATMVSWDQAAAYCEWQDKRLPTEAEWEYAARGPQGRTYPWGDAPPTRLRARFGGLFKGPIAIDTRPQGATPEGVFHLVGNVAEWVQDWWHPGYYALSPPVDPTGPEEGDFKVVRGGSWSQSAEELRAAARSYHNPDKGASYIGFRCARSAGTESPSP